VSLITAAVVMADSSAVLPGAQGWGIDVATVEDNDSNIKQLAENLYGDHVFAFELTSVLLVVAVAGTVILTRKWPKADADDGAADSSSSSTTGAAK
jgi:NADH-quinone oxidoreductase subunit J